MMLGENQIRPCRRFARLGAICLLVLLSYQVLPSPAGPGFAADPLFSHENPRFRSGAELLADCTAEAPEPRGRCAGYVMAIADVLGGAMARIDGVQVCLRGNESLGELVAAVRDHLLENPARQAIKGDGAVAYALSLYRPC
ncbi:hypothetical protein HBA54_06360 [Pelagibius litoralis]|uniref:Rap1a immunity protein domain-containing protein n=1 Tax=Pelagibius litoralis TaxID=374515 RepID=A0A967EX83_9PROT|nr:Rap1a/Tai family immunity protein [Pelagibius litoralis]NIA68210.1 hypothetical protein [Pelagibius litoralis]